jgi:hypothetical protein
LTTTLIVRLLPPFLFACLATASSAQQPPPRLGLGDAVVTGFSGTITAPATATRTPAADRTFIDPEGASARVIKLAQPGYTMDGRLFSAPKMFAVRAKDVGQVFGIALDDANEPNIYLAATSAFGLNIVARGRDGRDERRKIGGRGTAWMKGQFGEDLQGDPGSIYKVDGRTGAITLFAQAMLNGAANPGAALGGLAYDPEHRQLFAADLHTGMVHRFAIDTGNEAGPAFDHGVAGRVAAKLAAVAYSPASRPNIANNRFKADDPKTWGYAPPERRVWALAMHRDRLFYSVRNGGAKDGPQIWSVAIDRDGGFGADARLEAEVPAQPGPYPVTDIAFAQHGAMIVAQRAPVAASYDYSAFTSRGEPRVLRFRLKEPNDPPSPGRWKPEPEEYAVGFAGKYRNSNGGIALGYGYDDKGVLTTSGCESSLWVTGQSLRDAPPLRKELEPGGPLVVHGVFGVAADRTRPFNEPPWFSYPVDYDDTFDDPNAAGHLGSVRVFTAPCADVIARGGPGAASGGMSGPPSPPPPHDPPPTPKACFAARGTFECAHGQWVYKLTASGPSWINAVSAASLTSGVSVSGGAIPLSPANIGVSGPAGATALIEVCAFDGTAAASGKPYDCCRTRLTVKIPTQTCGAL